MSVSGSDTNGQEDILQGDAERHVKSLLPAVHVTAKTWVKVSDDCEQIKGVKEGLVSPTLDPPCILYQKFENEVTMVQKMIPSSSDLMSSDLPICVGAEELDPSLRTIKDHVAENYKMYKQNGTSFSSFTRVNLPVFCVTVDNDRRHQPLS